MMKYKTIGIIPVLENSRVKVYTLARETTEEYPSIDKVLKESPITYSGLAEFQALQAGVVLGPAKKDKADYKVVEIDPDFRIGNVMERKFFSSVETKGSPRIVFKDIEEYISWVNNSEESPKLLKEFETPDDYFNTMDSAIKLLSSKLMSDYKFNQLISRTPPQEPVKINEENIRKVEPGPEKKAKEDDSDPLLPSTKAYSSISINKEDTRNYSLGNLLGTLAESIKYLTLLHWTTNSYVEHKALSELINSVYDSIDSLAEKVLEGNQISEFNNEIYPKGDAVNYLSRLSSYIIDSSKVLFTSKKDSSSYQSIVDELVNAVSNCLYQIKNLGKSPVKSFSKPEVSRFFSRMFDASQAGEVELINQVQRDLNEAEKSGKVETEELDFIKDESDNSIMVTDNETGEVTKATPKYEGIEITSGDVSYILPKLTKAVEDLTDKVSNMNINTPTPKVEPEPSYPTNDITPPDGDKSDEKEMSAGHPNSRVVVTIDGSLYTGIMIEDYGANAKVKIPALDNLIITSDKKLFGIKELDDLDPRVTDSKKVYSFTSRTKRFSSKNSTVQVVQLVNGRPSKPLGRFNSVREAYDFIEADPKLKKRYEECTIDLIIA